MVKKEFEQASGKYLNSTEREAISKLKKIHQPVLKEMEKWKVQREKLETTLLDQIDMIGKILKPYYEQSAGTLTSLAQKARAVSTKYPNKKASPKKKSTAKKSKPSSKSKSKSK